jgi:prolipoprotein diacylglyceryltransferase
MKIDISDPAFFFAFFYVLSFGATFVLFVVFCERLKIPLRSALLILTTTSLCTIIGSRLSSVPFTDLGQVIVTGRFEEYEGRYAVGGLLFGLAGLVFSQHILRINKSIINLYAWITPIGLGIQKMGCFFNGCCYGKQSDLPWSIKYPIGTSAHYHQSLTGLINKDAVFSLGVNPVQLYEVILLFLISYIVWRSQKLWKKTWSTLIFSLILFSVFRFSVEFLRDPASSNIESRYLLGISLVQWILLFTGIVSSIILLLYENSNKNLMKDLSEAELSLRIQGLHILAVSVLIYVFRGMFTPFELLSLNLEFIPAVLLTVFLVFRSMKNARIKVATSSFFVLPLFLITQTFLPDSTKSVSYRDFFSQVKSYKRIDLNTSFGNFYNTLSYNPHEGECGTTYTLEDYNYLYWLTGGGYSNIKTDEKSITSMGINVYGGTLEEKNLTKQWEKTNFLFGVNPYIKYDLKWAGIGVGAHVGNLRWVPGKPIDESSFDRGTRFSPVLPEVMLRVGRRDILDFQYSYGFDLPAPLPVLLQEISIGTGFGFRTDYNLRFGAAFSENYSTTFISAEALIGKKIGLTFKYNFAGEDFYFSNNYSDFIERRGRFQFGANYRFGFKK